MSPAKRKKAMEIWQWADPGTRNTVFLAKYIAYCCRMDLTEVEKFLEVLEASQEERKNLKKK